MFAVNDLHTPSASKNRQFYKETGLFALIYIAYFAFVFLPVLLRSGFILGADGHNMYYPAMLNFRRTLLEFYQNIKNGSFEFPMVNFNHGFGIDNYTMTANQVSLLPWFIFCVFLPEKCMALFLTIPIFLLDFLAGIAFLRMCHHFSHHTYWNSLMAVSYCVSSTFFANYLYNPHFMNMLAALPLMVIGTDRLIQRKGWRLLCFCVFWLSLTSFTLLVYILPFLALFAIIRIAFLYRKSSLKVLFGTIARSIPVLLTGFLLSCIIQLPTLYLLKNSPRSVGNRSLRFAKLISFDLSRVSQCFSADPFGENDISIMPAFIAVPGMLLLLLAIPKRKELRTYMLAMMACIAFPLIDFGLNGFQYCLIRWGAVPALVFSFAGSVGMMELPKLEKKKMWRMVFAACMFGVLFSLELPHKIKGSELCTALIVAVSVCRMIPAICRAWARLCQMAKKHIAGFAAALKDNTSAVKHYLSLSGLAVGIVCCLGMIIMVILLPEYHLDVKIIICAAALIIVSALMLVKEKWTAFGIRALGAALTVSIVVMSLGFTRVGVTPVTPIPFFQASQELEKRDDSFNRVLYVTNYPDDVKILSMKEFLSEAGDQEESSEEELEESALQDGGKGWNENYGLGMGVPDAAFFHNMIDADLFSTLERCGQDTTDSPSMTLVSGYCHKEPLYSLFGIRYFGTINNELNDYGMKEVHSFTEDENVYRIYEYQYDLPIGVTYDSCISKGDADKIAASEYPYALLNYAFAEDPHGNEADLAAGADLPSYRCDIDCEKELHSTNNAGVDLFDHHITINDDTSDCLLYFEVSGADARQSSVLNDVSLRFTVDDTEMRGFNVSNSNSIWPWTRRADHYSFALGYHKKAAKTIDVRLPMKYDEINVYAIPASLLTEGYEARCSEVLKNVRMTTNQLEGDIDVSSDKLLSVGLIHNNGWSVEVDGKPAPLYKVNGLFIGTKLTEGSHHVRFVYRTSWLGIGSICTGSGIMMWIIMELITRRKRSESKDI